MPVNLVMEDVVEEETVEEGGDIMPGGDRTGPDGKGPRTGRGLGKASGNETGRGRGQGQGQGRGRDSRYPQNPRNDRGRRR